MVAIREEIARGFARERCGRAPPKHHDHPKHQPKNAAKSPSNPIQSDQNQIKIQPGPPPAHRARGRRAARRRRAVDGQLEGGQGALGVPVRRGAGGCMCVVVCVCVLMRVVCVFSWVPVRRSESDKGVIFTHRTTHNTTNIQHTTRHQSTQTTQYIHKHNTYNTTQNRSPLASAARSSTSCTAAPSCCASSSRGSATRATASSCRLGGDQRAPQLAVFAPPAGAQTRSQNCKRPPLARAQTHDAHNCDTPHRTAITHNTTILVIIVIVIIIIITAITSRTTTRTCLGRATTCSSGSSTTSTASTSSSR